MSFVSLQNCSGEDKTYVDATLENNVYMQELSYFLFMAAHGWFAYFFYQTTTETTFKFQNSKVLRNLPALESDLEDPSQIELTSDQIKQMVKQKRIFIVTGIGLFILGTIKAIYVTMDKSSYRLGWRSVLLSMTQMIEITIIILPLILALRKLRKFKTEHKQEVRKTKLTIHFAITILLQLLFIFDFVLQWRLASVFWIQRQKPRTLKQVQSEIHACLFWQIVLQIFRVLYSIPLFYLLIDFHRQGCQECSNNDAGLVTNKNSAKTSKNNSKRNSISNLTTEPKTESDTLLQESYPDSDDPQNRIQAKKKQDANKIAAAH